MKRPPRWLIIVLPVALGLLALLLWHFTHHQLAPGKRFLLPTPGRTLAALLERGPELASAARWTGFAALGGFGLAVLVSAVSALLLAASPLTRAALYPYLMMLQMTPIIIIAPILILWIGPGLPSVIVVTFLISFFPMVVNNTQGLVSTDHLHLDLFRTVRANPWQVMWLLRVPAALPYFFSGLRIAAVLAPIGALTGDYQVGTLAGGQAGLGIQALLYSSRNDIPALYATAFLACGLGFAFVGTVSLLSWFALRRWHESYARLDR